MTGVQTCALPIFKHGVDMIQDLTNRLIHEIDGLMAKKEKEIMEF